MKLVCDELEKSDNLFGLCLCKEMMAHRLSDMSVITSDLKYFEEAIVLYNWCAIISDRIGAHKNAFSAYYWAFMYLSQINPDDSRCLSLFYNFMVASDKHCQTKFIGKKIKRSVCTMKRISSELEWDKFVNWYTSIKNEMVRAIIFHIIKEIKSDTEYCCKVRKGEKWFK